MDHSYIKGSDELINYFGDMPIFHDDYIESIKISNGCICIIIHMKENAVKKGNEKAKLIFSDVKSLNLIGEIYSYVSIIFEVTFTKVNEFIHTEIETSHGVRGKIVSSNVEIKLYTW